MTSVVGALMLTPEFDNAGGALLVAAVGAGLGVVGALGGRRATTWIGGTLGALGLGSAVAIVVEPTSPGGVAMVGFVAAALLIGAAPLARYVRANRQPPASAGPVAR